MAELVLKRLSKEDLFRLGNLINKIYLQKLQFHERSKLLWDKKKYDRKLYAPPFTPSHDDTKLYKDFLSSNGAKSGEVLLLGSTPVLRCILNQELGIKNYVVADFSYKAIEGSTETLEYYDHVINTDDEIWIKTNWMQLPFEREFFGCIVGDFIFTQIEPLRQQKFIDKLKSLLKKEGVVIGRMYTCDTSRDAMDPQEIISEVVSGGHFQNTSDYRALLIRRLRDRLRDKKTKMVASESILEELLKFQTTELGQVNFLRSVAEMSSRRFNLSVPFISQTQSELESLFKKNFVVEKKAFASDYDSSTFPFYVLRKY